ncbi:MAG: ABC transporter permease [Dermatophilus congolensis]|nr:ABC transporter permease [Dermatophilus congolensis]
MIRNGEQLLVSLIFPLMALFGLAFTSSPSLGDGPRIDFAVPGVLALAIVSTAFTGQAISTGFDRRHGVLRYLGVTPLGRNGLLLGKAVAVLVIEVIQFVVIAGVGFALGWRPDVAGLLLAVPFWLIGSWAFVAIALLLAGTVRAEAVLAIANLVWVLLLGVGGLVIPTSVLPAAVQPVASLLPSAALGDGLRAAMTGGGLDLVALGILIAWALVATLATTRLFRWSD